MAAFPSLISTHPAVANPLACPCSFELTPPSPSVEEDALSISLIPRGIAERVRAIQLSRITRRRCRKVSALAGCSIQIVGHLQQFRNIEQPNDMLQYACMCAYRCSVRIQYAVSKMYEGHGVFSSKRTQLALLHVRSLTSFLVAQV